MYNDSLQQYLTYGRVKFLKKIFGPKFWSKGPKSLLKLGFFYHFLKFGILVFHEIAYNHNLQQFLTRSRGKVYEKNILDLKLGFLLFSQVSFVSFFEIAYNDSLQQCLACSRDKISEKNFLGPHLGQRNHNWS